MKHRTDNLILPVAGSVFVAGLSLTCFSFWFQHNLSQINNQQLIASAATPSIEPYIPPLIAVQAVVISDEVLAAIPAATESEPRQVNNPSPNYIAKTLSQTPADSKTTIANSFVGKHISWDATTMDLEDELGKGKVLYASFGLHLDLAPVQSFAIPVELPNKKYLLEVPTNSHFHVEGTIESFDDDNTPVLKDAVVTRLPYSSEGNPFSQNQ